MLLNQTLSLASIYSCLSGQFWSSGHSVGSNSTLWGEGCWLELGQINKERGIKKKLSSLPSPPLPELAGGSRKRQISRALGGGAVVACCNADCQSNTVGGRHNASLFGLALVCPTSLPPHLFLFSPLCLCFLFPSNYIEKQKPQQQQMFSMCFSLYLALKRRGDGERLEEKWTIKANVLTPRADINHPAANVL